MAKRWGAWALALLLALPPAAARQDADGGVAIAAGAAHVAARLSDGRVQAWGQNDKGQCDVAGWQGVTAVACGAYHTVALLRDGTAAACGDNSQGQCDVGDWQGLVAVSAGNWHTVGLRADGTVVACGDGAQDALNPDSPCAVSAWRGVRAISAGARNTVAMADDGSVLACGDAASTGRTDRSRFAGARQVLAGPQWMLLTLFGDGACDSLGYSEVVDLTVEDMCTVCHPGVDRFVPLHPHALDYFHGIVALFAGPVGAYALTEQGAVRAAGEDWWGLHRCEQWQDIVQLAVGGSFVAGLGRDGRLRWVGGQAPLGCGEDTDQRELPFAPVDLSMLEGLAVSPEPLPWPYPAPVPGPHADAVRAAVDRARADCAACLAAAGRRDAQAQAIARAHPEYDDVYSFHKGLALFRTGDLYGLLDADGREVLPARYAFVERADTEGMCAVEDETGKIGFIDVYGIPRIPCRYDLAGVFEGGYARVGRGEWMDPTWSGYVDREGREYSEEEYRALTGRSDGEIETEERQPETGPLFLFSDPPEASDHTPARYGFRDAGGREVIPALFDRAWALEDGLAAVILNDTRGHISPAGDVVDGLMFAPAWLPAL